MGCLGTGEQGAGGLCPLESGVQGGVGRMGLHAQGSRVPRDWGAGGEQSVPVSPGERGWACAAPRPHNSPGWGCIAAPGTPQAISTAGGSPAPPAPPCCLVPRLAAHGRRFRRPAVG